MKKIDYFNWFMKALLEEYEKDCKCDNARGGNNDLSKLKVLKLLFLSVAEDEEKLNIFDNFVAWDLWPVELDIYEKINLNNDLLAFEINNKSAREKNGVSISENAIEEWKKMVLTLKTKNSNLIKSSASKLVDITHEWRCWRIGNMLWKLKLSKELILESNKFYGNEYF